jgi:hypothetical protein
MVRPPLDLYERLQESAKRDRRKAADRLRIILTDQFDREESGWQQGSLSERTAAGALPGFVPELLFDKKNRREMVGHMLADDSAGTKAVADELTKQPQIWEALIDDIIDIGYATGKKLGAKEMQANNGFTTVGTARVDMEQLETEPGDRDRTGARTLADVASGIERGRSYMARPGCYRRRLSGSYEEAMRRNYSSRHPRRPVPRGRVQ